MVENSDFFLKELFHWVAKADTPSEVFVVKIGNFIEDRCPSAFSNLA